MKQCEIKNLYNLEQTMAKELLETMTYPWEVLPKIGEFIKKLGEENAEFIKAFLTEPPYETAAEAADYIYHLMVALRFKGIDFTEVLKELEKRHAPKGDK